MMIFLIPDYHTEKTLSKQFQLWFPAHHKKLVKLNENQSNKTKKFKTTFREKITKECCDPDETLAENKGCLRDTAGVTPKLIGVKFRKLPGNINYSKFPSGWINYKICIGEVENSNFSQRGVGLKTRFLPGSFPGWIQSGQ